MANDGMPDLGTMLGEVMRDPEKMAQLRGIMTALSGGNPPDAVPEQGNTAPAAEEKRETEAEDTAEAVSLPSNAMLGSLLSNPALLSALPSLLSTLGASPHAPSSPGGRRPDHRTALLLALKPYLSDGRRQMIDYIVNISRLGDQLGR